MGLKVRGKRVTGTRTDLRRRLVDPPSAPRPLLPPPRWWLRRTRRRGSLPLAGLQ
jgi:hypothetical protein